MLTAIESLFNDYLTSFKNYCLEGVTKCYHLPCTLNTPDKVVLLKTIADCEQEFTEIFAQLKHANTSKIIARKASYVPISENLFLACVDWDFIDDKNEVFADFCAYYHLVQCHEDKPQLKIINVSSHELSNSLSLAIPFLINS